jgi:glucose-6-phosphate-specific signal transduction histidine kinase
LNGNEEFKLININAWFFKELKLKNIKHLQIFRSIKHCTTFSGNQIGITIESSIYIYLEIMDNGKGISLEQIKDFKSLGIHGMEERAMVFGGQVYVEGIPGKGTIVKVEIPID